MTKPTGRPRGRPKGSQTRRTLEIAEKAAAEGISPLEVMIRAMRYFWDLALADPKKPDPALLKEASQLAERAAPFMHPRLASVEQFVDQRVVQWVVGASPDLTPEQWALEFGDQKLNKPTAIPAPTSSTAQ